MKGVNTMRYKWISALVAISALAGAGAAVASHVTEVDPATVPTGFLAAHNAIEKVPVSALARAVKPNGADVFIQHVRLGANAATGWHTHPGPAFVTIVKGELTYEDACSRVLYAPGRGFVDRGFGHVHRAIAGPDGVDFYVAYVLPRGSTTHVIPASAPSTCRGEDGEEENGTAGPDG
jgi:quercetin dioxygenase-like cupin family protein